MYQYAIYSYIYIYIYIYIHMLILYMCINSLLVPMSRLEQRLRFDPSHLYRHSEPESAAVIRQEPSVSAKQTLPETRCRRWKRPEANLSPKTEILEKKAGHPELRAQAAPEAPKISEPQSL